MNKLLESFLISRRQAVEGIGIAAVLPSTVTTSAAQTPAGKISATVDTTKTGEPISKYLYGAFVEHLGYLIDYALWSEVLDDRKFFYSVNSEPPATPSRPRGADRENAGKWYPVGPDSAIVMDTQNQYVGEHSPVVTCVGSEPRGLQQGKLSLVKGKRYTGRIVVAGNPGVTVMVSLIWGADAGNRQTVTVPAGREWATQPIEFICKADTTDGYMEITGTGIGTFKVGAVSLMPDDNVQGFRAETVALLKTLDSGMWRLPGGNIVSNMDWKYTIGDPDKRPPIWDNAWGEAQPNDVGVHEFLTFCKLIGVDPYWCVNTGFGEARSGAELVEYINGDETTPMGKLRVAHGFHTAPYRVKYFNVGNEMYGKWQIGHMILNHYTIKHNLFAEAMKKVDPNIIIIASSAMPDEMTCTEAMMYPDEKQQPQIEFGSDRDWAGGLLDKCYGNFNILAEHAYTGGTRRWDARQGKMVAVDEPLVESGRRMANRIRCKAEAWEEYKKRFPALNDGKVKVSLDEWHQGGGGLEQALIIGLSFHEMFRHTDFLTMAAFTMGTSWLDYTRTNATYSATGVAFNLYNKYFGKIPVDVTGNTPMPPPKYPVGGDQPRVNAGSPTYPLDVSAALKDDGKTLTLAVVNATDTEQHMDINLAGFQPKSQGRMWRLTGPSLAAVNKVGLPPQITVKEAPFNASAKTLSVVPYSIELYEFVAA